MRQIRVELADLLYGAPLALVLGGAVYELGGVAALAGFGGGLLTALLVVLTSSGDSNAQ